MNDKYKFPLKSNKVASQVASRSPHQVNKIDLNVKLYYENIGPDPFFKETKFVRLRDSIEDAPQHQQQQRSRLEKTSCCPSPAAGLLLLPSSIDEFEAKKKEAQHLLNKLTADKMEKKFDMNNLSAQQAEYIIKLQSLYNELNCSSNLGLMGGGGGSLLETSMYHQQSLMGNNGVWKFRE